MDKLSMDQTTAKTMDMSSKSTDQSTENSLKSTDQTKEKVINDNSTESTANFMKKNTDISSQNTTDQTTAKTMDMSSKTKDQTRNKNSKFTDQVKEQSTEKTATKEDGYCGVGARKKMATSKGKEYESITLKENRTSALRQVTRAINKIKPLLHDVGNVDFVSSEIEVLNGLISKLHDTHDKYLNSLSEETDINDAMTWFETHDNAIFKFRHSVCEYMASVRKRQASDNHSVSHMSRHSSRSSASRRSGSSRHSYSSISSRLVEARTKIASLEVKAAFLQERQALKLAAEELELRESLAQARQEEKIIEQLNNEEFTSTPIIKPDLLHLPESNMIPSYIASLNEQSSDSVNDNTETEQHEIAHNAALSSSSSTTTQDSVQDTIVYTSALTTKSLVASQSTPYMSASVPEMSTSQSIPYMSASVPEMSASQSTPFMSASIPEMSTSQSIPYMSASVPEMSASQSTPFMSVSIPEMSASQSTPFMSASIPEMSTSQSIPYMSASAPKMATSQSTPYVSASISEISAAQGTPYTSISTLRMSNSQNTPYMPTSIPETSTSQGTPYTHPFNSQGRPCTAAVSSSERTSTLFTAQPMVSFEATTSMNVSTASSVVSTLPPASQVFQPTFSPHQDHSMGFSYARNHGRSSNSYHGTNQEHNTMYNCAFNANGFPVYASPTRDNSFQEFVDIQRKQTELSQLIVSQQARSLLPAHKPPTFRGDPMDYPAFITAFQSLIESKVDNSCERLYFLGQYTSGKAKELINGCLQRKTKDAYSEAKQLLQSHFGDPFKIANAHIARLSSWPIIKPNDGLALQEFSIAMQQAKSAMKGMSHMNDLNTAHVLRQLWEKLPRHLRSRWTERNSKTKSIKGRIADFEEFSEFVREQADLATDPVFSENCVSKLSAEDRERFTNSKFVGKSTRRGKGSSFATNVSSSKGNNSERNFTCALCEGSHNLNNCDQFMKKPLSDRRDFIKQEKLCYSCLNGQHIAKHCKEKKICKTCNKQHPTSLHDNNWSKKSKDKGESNETGQSAKVNSNRIQGDTITEDMSINMGILPVWLYHKDNPTKKIKTYALLDNGSGGTFITEESARNLNIKGLDTNLVLSTIHGTKNVSTEAIEGLVVANFTDESTNIVLPRTFTQKSIPVDRNEIPRPEVLSALPHLNNISKRIPPYMEEVKVGLLIGVNCPAALRPRDVVYGSESDPYALRSLLGWYTIGPVHSASHRESATCNRIRLEETKASTTAKGYLVNQSSVKEQITPRAVEQMFQLDFSEREKGTALSREDLKFYETVENGIVHLEDLHYEMPLPLKIQNVLLPNNLEQAEKRLSSLKNRLASDEQYRKEYTDFMTEIISKGYARRIDNSSQGQKGRIWYLPHHGVRHPQKPTKLRIVFDCSAKYEGQSLNDCLLQGPDLTSNLIGVLTRFRQERYAFMADIEKMFFQVKVKKEDQDLLRFLWWPNGNIEERAEVYCMTVHLFGAGSSPACANYALKRAADDNENEYGSEVADTLRRNFYVDDVLKSAETEDKVIELTQNVKKVCANGGFNLTKFVGSTERIINAIPPEQRAINVRNLNLGQDVLPIERVLGVQWSIESDAFKFRIELKDRPCTRRGILATVSSVYDPLGFIAPVVLVGKKILQDICHTNSWDDPVDDSIRSRWEKWRSELYLLEDLDVPRSFKSDGFGKVVSAQLHNISDASTTGYGQCSYLRLKDKDGKVNTSFVMGKARVTPKKTVSIPRLELAAATVSVKVADTLKEELDYTEIEDYYWTDSKVVLGYISNESRRFHTYVANRVQYIQDHTNSAQWRYIETAANPADEGSRGMSARDFVEKSRWLKGPDFLNHFDEPWLTPESFTSNIDLDSPEVKKIHVHKTTVTDNLSSIPERLQRFSNWQKAKTAISLCLLYKRKLRSRLNSNQALQTPISRKEAIKSVLSQINVNDLQEAELEIIKHVQGTEFPSELKKLKDMHSDLKFCTRAVEKARKATLKKTSSLHTLDPYVDDKGVIRVGGRIRRAALSESIKNPIILPKSSHVTNLIIRHVHEQVHHSGRGITLNELRINGYWVISGNTMVRQCIAKCVTCRRLRGALGEQKMADLPQSRLQPAPIFMYCGIDYFGPWEIRRGRATVKRYGALFTCMASRAVHIEVADSLDTDSFIQALRRFICRRGPIREIRCDRGSNFIGAEAELKKAIDEIDDEKVKAQLLKDNIDWVKNPACASNFGGAWERQIRSIRNIMNSLIREHGSSLDDESLRTFLCEAEATVNSRPLTVETLSDPNSDLPLSPSMLLTGKTKLVLPPHGEFMKTDMYCKRKWKRTQHLAQEFWTRWSKEYLQQMQSRQKWTQPRRNFQVDDVVLLKEANSPRNKWSLARVVSVYPDDQGQVRSVTVLTPRGSKLDRPVNKLVLLVESR